MNVELIPVCLIVVLSLFLPFKKQYFPWRYTQILHCCFIILDESQHKLVHAAKCLNIECDRPINIPWKENCQIVRKPEKTAEKENKETNGDFTNGHHEELEEIPQSVEGLRCEECGTKFTENHVEKFIKAMEFTEMHLQNMKGASVACILLLTVKFIVCVNNMIDLDDRTCIPHYNRPVVILIFVYP